MCNANLLQSLRSFHWLGYGLLRHASLLKACMCRLVPMQYMGLDVQAHLGDFSTYRQVPAEIESPDVMWLTVMRAYV